MRIVGLVPARRGSVRLPRKNVLDLGGLPLVEHTLRCAGLCPQLEAIVVSTDDPEVRAIAAAADIDVLDRPAELASNEATAWSVVQHTARELGDFETLVLLQPTSPFRLPEDVEAALALLGSAPEADGVVGVCDDGAGGTRPSGTVYAWREAFVRSEVADWQDGQNVQYRVPAPRALDIDDAADLERARELLRSGKVSLPWLSGGPSPRR